MEAGGELAQSCGLRRAECYDAGRENSAALRTAPVLPHPRIRSDVITDATTVIAMNNQRDSWQQPWAEPAENQRMFERVARRYDRLNTLMSLGRHHAWRRELVARVAPRPVDLALDVGSGTGDLALSLAGRARLVLAADLTPAMLQGALTKFDRSPGGAWMRPVLADALALPFPDATFECVVSGFVLRNLADLEAGLREWHRVLKPGGTVGLLEMTHARGPQRLVQRAQLRFVAPLLARVAGARTEDYRYIARSLERFPDASTLAELLRSVGFRDVRYRLLMLGSVAIHTAVHP